jgi:hypothetical protein
MIDCIDWYIDENRQRQTHSDCSTRQLHLLCKVHNIRNSTTAGEEEEAIGEGARLKLANHKVSRLMGFAQWGFVSADGNI